MRAKACAALLLAALLAGCGLGNEEPVIGRPPSPAPAASSTVPAAAVESPAAADTPVPTPMPPPVWAFPLGVTSLFGGKIPEGYARPVHLERGGGRFLYATADGSVLLARWDGSEYGFAPVAESLSAGARMSVDAGAGRLYAVGDRLTKGGKPVPSPVIVDLDTAGRCFVADWIAWGEGPVSLSCDCQAAGGTLLVRLEEERGGEAVPLDRWLAVDVERRAASEIDLEGFAAKHLPQWQDVSRPALALLGRGRLLAAFTVSGDGDPVCVAFEMDGGGAVTRECGVVTGAEGAAALSRGAGFTASLDGRFLLYTAEGAGGAYRYDAVRNEESTLAKGPSRLLYAEWYGDGSACYCLDGAQTIERFVPQAGPEPSESPGS